MKLSYHMWLKVGFCYLAKRIMWISCQPRRIFRSMQQEERTFVFAESLRTPISYLFLVVILFTFFFFSFANIASEYHHPFRMWGTGTQATASAQHHAAENVDEPRPAALKALNWTPPSAARAYNSDRNAWPIFWNGTVKIQTYCLSKVGRTPQSNKTYKNI